MTTRPWNKKDAASLVLPLLQTDRTNEVSPDRSPHDLELAYQTLAEIITARKGEFSSLFERLHKEITRKEKKEKILEIARKKALST